MLIMEVGDSHHFNWEHESDTNQHLSEKSDQDPDPHQRRTIRIRINVMRLRNTGFYQNRSTSSNTFYISFLRKNI